MYTVEFIVMIEMLISMGLLFAVFNPSDFTNETYSTPGEVENPTDRSLIVEAFMFANIGQYITSKVITTQNNVTVTAPTTELTSIQTK